MSRILREGIAVEEMRVERLGGGVELCVSERHRFGTDAFLLSRFAAPRAGERACDLGCGCGVVGLLWFCDAGQAPASLDAVDIQAEAASLAQASAERSGLGERVRVHRADLRALPDALPRAAFDLVACNPPYRRAGAGIPSAQASDRIARHETACTVADACAAAQRLLRFGGRFCVCLPPERLPDLFEAMRAHRLEPKRLRCVQKEARSAPWLVLCEGRLGAKPFLQTLPPLIQYENGRYTEEMEAHYALYRKPEESGKRQETGRSERNG